MEAVFRDEVSGKTVSHEVSETATAAGLLREVCALFGREVLDSALEVDGAVVCTGVVGGGEASVGSLGVHSESELVLRRSRDRVLAVVVRWAESLRGPAGRLVAHPAPPDIPEWAWDDEAVVLAAVAANAASEFFRSGRTSDSFMRDAMTRNVILLGPARAELQADKDVVMTAVATSGASLAHASKSLKDDKEVVMTAVANDGTSLVYASKRLKADKELVMTAVAKVSLLYASSALKADKEVVMTAVAHDGASLCHASEALKADKEVVMTAVANGASLFYANSALRADKEVVMTAVANHGVSLLDASEKLRADREVVMTAITNDGASLRYASEELKADTQLVLAAAASQR